VKAIETEGDNTPDVLEPARIASSYSTSLNTYLSKLLPTRRTQTAYAIIFNTKKSVRDIQYMFTTRHIVGRVWRIVFPEQDTYIYNNVDGTRSVLTVLRRVQNGRRYLGIDFWYSHYYLVGRYGIPDFYKLVAYTGIEDVHALNKPVILVTEPRATTYYVKCHVEPTPSTTTYTLPPTVPTSVPKVCEDITQLPSSVLEELPLSDVKITPAPATKASAFEFSSPQQTSTIEYSITAEKGAVLASLTLEGTFTSYQVFVADENGNKVGPTQNLLGADTFDPGMSHDFNRNISEMHTITLIITGPSTGFYVNVTEFDVCLPEFKFCRLTQDEVLQRLSYLPLNGILGTSVDDGEEVNYGLNMAHGDVLEDGTVVKGHCYECECTNYTLVCRIVEDCRCPNYTTRCEGTCDNPVLVVEFDVEGVDPSCKPNDTCTPSECTTPYDCPSSWGEWSECTNCMRTRTRTCHDSCGDVCDSMKLTETDICGDCTSTTTTTVTTMIPPTTEYCDGDNEEYKCYNHYVRCNETCRAMYNEDACSNLQNVDEDMPCNYSCGCKDGYKRNAAGHCVKMEECECYNGTIPLPVNYRENVSECRYCECKMSEGYICTDIPNCCDIGEWEEWSSCSVTCGDGTRTRTRKVKSGECSDKELTETQSCSPGDCPCILNGKIYQPDEIMDDECRYCKCENGAMTCTSKNNTRPWNPTCDQTCYCADESSEKICVNSPPKCDVDPAKCNNDTHYTVPDPNNSCCKICKPRMKPCEKKVVESKTLNFTHATHGRCVSPPLDVGRCEGSCGFSKSGGDHYAYKRGATDLPIFDIDYFSACECCQAQLAATEVEFTCDKSQEKVKIKVTQIDSCKCTQCT